MIIFCVFFLIISLFLTIKIFRDTMEIKQLNHDFDAAIEGLNIQKEYCRIAQSNAEKFAEVQHDFLNQLHICYSLFESGVNKEKAIRLMKGLKKWIGEIAPISYSNNLVLDTVLSVKSYEAKTYNIDVDIRIDIEGTDIYLDDLDIISVFGNLFDNAIEACQHDNLLKKFIKLSMIEKSGFLVIKLTNSYGNMPQIDNKFHKFKSSKPNRNGKGLGIDIISQIIEKNKGDYIIECKEKYLEFVIIFETQDNKDVEKREKFLNMY